MQVLLWMQGALDAGVIDADDVHVIFNGAVNWEEIRAKPRGR
jgi:hypothetical protein